MKKTLLLATIATSIFALNANAMDFNPYVSAKLKYAVMDNSVDGTYKNNESGYEYKWDVDDNVFGGSIALGVFTPLENGAFRTEVEYTKNAEAEKTNFSIIKAKAETQAVLANLYYDINTGSKLTPYIGAGIGGAKVKFSVEDESEDKTTFAWQIGAGIAYALTDKLSLDMGYRFIHYGDFTQDEELFDEYEHDKFESKAHEIHLGLRYNF